MALDAIVVGTGITGSFTALALHERGMRIAVVDRGGLAPGTSRSCDGNLLCSDKEPGPLLELAAESLRLWRDFIDRHENHCEFDPKGATVAARGPAAAARLADFVAAQRQAGIDCEFLDGDWERLEPALGPDVRGVGHWPGDAQVQPMLACYQIARALKQAGVEYRFYQPVEAIEERDQGVAVRLASGETLAAERVCLCAGVWTGSLLRPLDVSLPVRPRKGHICVLERGDVQVNSKIADFAYNATVDNAADAGVQTAAVIEATQSGTILCGSSRQFAGFDLSVETPVLRRILADCIALVPALARLRVIRGYAGLRPHSPDGLPIIGPVGARGRIIVATGHEGSGHGLAPITGKLVADMLVDGVERPWRGLLHPERFQRCATA